MSEIYLYWQPPIAPNGVVIAYEVTYRPADSWGPEISLNTSDESFSTEEHLEEGADYIFSVSAYTRVGPGPVSSLRASTLIPQRK